MPMPDTLDKQVADLSCPFKPDDPRCVPWLQGYAVGYAEATEKAIAKLEETIGVKLR